jgi:NAD-dependent DNA ligase
MKGSQSLLSQFYGCPPQIIGRIQHYISRKAMDIEGLGGETVALLFNNDLVQYADLYELTVEQILPLERMAQKSADNLVKGVEDSKTSIRTCSLCPGNKICRRDCSQEIRNIIKILMH